jgi:hypothetical protein
MATMAFGAIAVASCKSDTDPAGSGGGQDYGGAPNIGGGHNQPMCGELGNGFGSAACGECAEASCCDELATCDANSACPALIDCRAACSDQACVNQCNLTHEPGFVDFANLDGCLMTECSAECPTSDGICDTGLTIGDPECDQCLGDNCCTPLTACLNDAACSACIDGTGVDCANDALFGAVDACFTDNCSAMCSG